MTKNDLRKKYDRMLMNMSLEAARWFGLRVDELHRDIMSESRIACKEDAFRYAVEVQVFEQWLDTVLERKLQEADDER